jgi:hypothetical protein
MWHEDTNSGITDQIIKNAMPLATIESMAYEKSFRTSNELKMTPMELKMSQVACTKMLCKLRSCPSRKSSFTMQVEVEEHGTDSSACDFLETSEGEDFQSFFLDADRMRRELTASNTIPSKLTFFRTSEYKYQTKQITYQETQRRYSQDMI